MAFCDVSVYLAANHAAEGCAAKDGTGVATDHAARRTTNCRTDGGVALGGVQAITGGEGCAEGEQ